MFAIVLAATAAPSGDLPIWVVVAGMLLAGGSVAAAFQYLSKRNETKASSSTTEATANLTGVEALTNVITTLSEENGRLTTRLTDFSAAFDRLEAKLDDSRVQVAGLQALLEKRPTKEDLFALIEKLRDQLTDAGEVPVNGPTKP